jgi:hypothetical protein
LTWRNGTTATSVTVIDPMFENITGQTNTNPSEPISVGVLSAPFHGAGVDGFKYFSTLNGNTVASNVVTEATGAHIDSSQAAAAGGVTAGVVNAVGPVGLLTEASAQNLALQSQTLANAAWGGAANKLTPVDNVYVAPDGTTTMASLTAVAGNTLHYIVQDNISLTAAPQTHFAFLKYVNKPLAALQISDNVTSFWANFNLQTGAVGAHHASATSAIYPTKDPTIFLCVIAVTTASTATGHGYIIMSNADSAPAVWSAAGTEVMGAWGVDIVHSSIASSYIPNVASANTRPADVDQYVSAGNLSATAMTIAMEITPSTALGSATAFHFGTYVDASNYTAILSDGTNLIARKRISSTNHDATIAFTRTAGTTVKAVARFDGTNGVDIWLGGTKGTPDTTTTASQIGTNFQIGGDGNGANQDYSEHRNFLIWLGSLSNSAAAAWSTP